MRKDATSRFLKAEDDRLCILMIAAQEGDKAGYAELLVACEPVIRRVARRAGAHRDWIDDIVQDTLLTLHGARQTYDPSRSFIAWLTTISQRRAIDLMRRNGRRNCREVHAPIEYEQRADPQADTAGAWRETSRAEELERAVAGLTTGQRQAVEMIALQGRSLADVAASTGRTKGALKVNFHRALKALKRRIDTGGEDG